MYKYSMCVLQQKIGGCFNLPVWLPQLQGLSNMNRRVGHESSITLLSVLSSVTSSHSYTRSTMIITSGMLTFSLPSLI